MGISSSNVLNDLQIRDNFKIFFSINVDKILLGQNSWKFYIRSQKSYSYICIKVLKIYIDNFVLYTFKVWNSLKS